MVCREGCKEEIEELCESRNCKEERIGLKSYAIRVDIRWEILYYTELIKEQD